MMDHTRTASSTPASSPGLFNPNNNSNRTNLPPPSDGTPHSSPYLHPLQMHKVRETHKASVEQDFITGRKLINQYEILNELGRGVHGKVKLARSLETGEQVAIKIIQRFSKKRKLGRVTVSPEDKTKREIAILKKIRHSNVVGLLEVIDDPELKKIYMVLEHVELGEIVWRKKGDKNICHLERRRIEREQRGEIETGEDEKYFKMIERKRLQKDAKQAKIAQANAAGHAEYWSLEHGDDLEDDLSSLSRESTHDSTQNLGYSNRSLYRSNPGSRAHSQAASRAPSRTSSRAHTPHPTEFDIPAIDSDNEGETPMELPSYGSATALEGTYYGSYADDAMYRGRSPSTADSVISHMSSMDGMPHDAFEDDFSYVPCFTLEQARCAFRDTVLGLEYLHYEGIVHRDIKPANLLWTKDHRVKISDFGVSYFGRPIRDGEMEENISEADATDFDNDLELAKTVGTPAFFAPELCYTDLDIEQPRITEQIDVWSLGVTLYCIIFARIPFLADDEYQLFRSIAKDNVYIPRRRLKAVDPNAQPPQGITIKRTGPSPGPFRDDGELAFEEIDEELHDLLRRMLIKDPAERIKLREVKRHPWVIKGLHNVIGWLDDTDPSRRTAGRRIQVDRGELERAVVPITFLERARSAVKKAVGKVIGVARSETRSEGSRRRRAVSNATSSGADTHNSPSTPVLRDSRRSSLRGDELHYMSLEDVHLQHHREIAEHPLAQSLTVSPDLSYDGRDDPFALDFAQHSHPVGDTPMTEPVPSGTTTEPDTRPGPPDRAISAAASIQTVVQRGHSHSRSVNSPTIGLLDDPRYAPGPFTDHNGALFGGHLWTGPRGRDYLAEIEEGVVSRARSVDRSLFESDLKHSEPVVATSSATATGKFEHSPITLKKPSRFQSRSTSVSPTSATAHEGPLASPTFFHRRTFSAYQNGQSSSTPSMPQTVLAASNLEQRPSTANRTPEGKTPPPRVYESTAESFRRAKEVFERRRMMEAEAEDERQRQLIHTASNLACPPSPDDDIFVMKQEEAARRAQSYSSVNSYSLTSPSDFNSPISSANLGSTEQFYASVPSLPALISGASSVSADTEGDMLQLPGVPQLPDHGFTRHSTPDSVTPPALSKDNATSIPEEEDDGYNGDGDTRHRLNDDSDSDSDDDCLTMGKRKPAKRSPVTDRGSFRKLERKNTNNSVGSTETAKKVEMER